MNFTNSLDRMVVKTPNFPEILLDLVDGRISNFCKIYSDLMVMKTC